MNVHHQQPDQDGPGEAEFQDLRVCDLYNAGLLSRAEADVLNSQQQGHVGEGNWAEQEAEQLLRRILENHPLPEAPAEPQAPQPEGVYTLTEPESQTLNCFAIIRFGHIIPIIDLEETPLPKTPGERMHYMALTARTLLDGLMDALEFWEERRRQRGDDRDEGGASCRS